MSTGIRIEHRRGMEIAAQLKAHLEGSGVVLWAAGSLRRREATVGDIDLVGVLDGRRGPLVARLSELPPGWVLGNKALSTETRAVSLTYVGDGAERAVAVQVFLCPPEGFGWIYMLRTGPAEFGKELVNIVRPWGFRFDDGRLCRVELGGDLLERRETLVPLDTPNERAVFDALGLPYLAVCQRTAAKLRLAGEARGENQ